MLLRRLAVPKMKFKQHLHFHIMPRFAGLEFKMHARDMEDAVTLEEHAERVRAHLPV